MSIYIGSDFKQKFADKQFYRITNYNEIHNGFVYKTGLNEDIKHITTKTCSDGLYFTDIDNLPYWIDSYFKSYWRNIKYLRKVEIVDDSIVVDESNDKYKTNKFILDERVEIFDSEIWTNVDMCIKMVNINNDYVTNIKNSSKKYNMTLINKDIKPVLENIKNSSLDVKVEYLKKYPTEFVDMGDFSEEFCNFAVNFIDNIKHVPNQTEKQCWIALKNNINNIKYIKNPTNSMKTFAIVNNISITTFDNVTDYQVELNNDMNSCNDNILTVGYELSTLMKNIKSDVYSKNKQIEDSDSDKDSDFVNVDNVDTNNSNNTEITNDADLTSELQNYISECDNKKEKINQIISFLQLYEFLINKCAKLLITYPQLKVQILEKLLEFKNADNIGETFYIYIYDKLNGN